MDIVIRGAFICRGWDSDVFHQNSASLSPSPSQDSVGIEGSKYPPPHENSVVPSSLELKEAKSYKAVDFPLLHGLIIIEPSFIHPEFLEAYKGKIIVQNINSSNLQCYSGPQFPNLYSEMVDIDELSVALNLWLSSVSFLLPQHLKASGDRRKLTRNGPLQGRGNCGLLHLTALGVVPA